jgi:isoquinoline 1-oxidoreductase subunit beta
LVEGAQLEKEGGSVPPAGVGRGIAGHFTFSGYVAVVADVSVDAGAIKVRRLVAAVDCGTVVKPSGARAQVEGAMLDGLQAALRGEITVERGPAVVNAVFGLTGKRLRVLPLRLEGATG